MSAPSDSVMALVSGLPSPARGRRLLMVIQAYVDDSGSHEASPVFVLAGFITDHDAWASFSDEWQAALNLEPRLEYFKMAEAASLHGQFHASKGWDEKKRDKRLEILTDIVCKYVKLKISISIRYDHFAEHIRSLPAVERSISVDHPFMLVATQLMITVVTVCVAYGCEEPCNFIFDETDGLADEFLGRWEETKKIIAGSPRPEVFSLLGERPLFKDEKKFMPLQAADLYAWNVRQNWIENRVLWVPPSKTLKMLARISSIERHYNLDEVMRLRAYLIQVGEKFKKDNPNTPLIERIRDERERRKTYKRIRKKRKTAK